MDDRSSETADNAAGPVSFADDWWSAREAARALRVAPFAIDLLRRSGKLPGARRTLHGWRYPAEQVCALLQTAEMPSAAPVAPAPKPDVESALRDAAGPEMTEDITYGPEEWQPVIRLVNALLAEAIQRDASDLRITPTANQMLVHWRQGTMFLHELEIPRHIAGPVTRRVAVMSDLEAGQMRLPQSGRLALRHDNRDFVIRAQSLPTPWGLSLSLRLHDEARATADVIGLPEPIHLAASETLENGGLLVVAAPPGGGATTTAVALLKDAVARGASVATLEAPIEYAIPGATQIGLNPRLGVRVATGLAAARSSGARIVLIGRIDTDDREAVRDALTAGIAIVLPLAARDPDGLRLLLQKWSWLPLPTDAYAIFQNWIPESSPRRLDFSGAPLK